MFPQAASNYLTGDSREHRSRRPAGWFRGNTSTSISAPGSVNYLVIDGANHNTLSNNQGGGSGEYDIELTALAFRFGLPEKLPASYDNIVNVGRYDDVTVKDCGDNNKVHGVDPDTDLAACPGA